ncbi:hypothetical protein RRG08_044031 [Elysia crispata]|uniref:Uncharacterized protein n=1 Tax=Elysia crispata TaxID=231223 RepID=A0AAE1CRG1_9GAST|nr:hypothetical protein RRG08_044031 [Elysia crispata]
MPVKEGEKPQHCSSRRKSNGANVRLLSEIVTTDSQFAISKKMSSGSEGMQKMLPEAHPRKKHPLHPLCARTAFSCNKLFLFIYALIFLFVGIVLMAIGTLVELHRSRIEPINNRLAVPTALVIFVGLAIAVNALVGMIGTVMEKPCLLKVFLVVTVLCFLLQVTIGIIAFIFREEMLISRNITHSPAVGAFGARSTSSTLGHPDGAAIKRGHYHSGSI